MLEYFIYFLIGGYREGSMVLWKQTWPAVWFQLSVLPIVAGYGTVTEPELL